jgi:hypothetical protein
MQCCSSSYRSVERLRPDGAEQRRLSSQGLQFIQRRMAESMVRKAGQQRLPGQNFSLNAIHVEKNIRGGGRPRGMLLRHTHACFTPSNIVNPNSTPQVKSCLPNQEHRTSAKSCALMPARLFRSTPPCSSKIFTFSIVP